MATQQQIDFIQAATGSNAANAALYADGIYAAMDKFNINTPARQTAFLSQIGEESNHLQTASEYASGSAYENRPDLGNTSAGDGVKYKGRGLIQITGKSNYQAVSNALGVDFVNNPTLLATPQYAALASAWWWNNHGLNQLADGIDMSKPANSPDTVAINTKITRIINGGTNGLAVREGNFASGWNYLASIAQQVTDVASSAASATVTQVKKHPYMTVVIVLGLASAAALLLYVGLDKPKAA